MTGIDTDASCATRKNAAKGPLKPNWRVPPQINRFATEMMKPRASLQGTNNRPLGDVKPIVQLADEQRGENVDETGRCVAARIVKNPVEPKAYLRNGPNMKTADAPVGTECQIGRRRKAVTTYETETGNGRNGKKKAGRKQTAEASLENERANGGDRSCETETRPAAICQQLQELQRQRVCMLKTRIMLENRLVSSVAVSLGYRSGLEEADRKKAWDAARASIKRITGGSGNETEHGLAPLVTEATRAIDGFNRHVSVLEKRMEKLAAKLPVAAWVAAPEQRGFGIKSLAILVGECGDLAGYANPGKLWRRMGCAPFESQGVMRMGSRWKSAKPGLSSEEWESFGYSPRRRSVAYVFGENLVKLNFVGAEPLENESLAAEKINSEAVGAGEPSSEIELSAAGPYRARYDSVKAAKLVLASDDWPKLRCHRHAMLLAVKLLMRELWKTWNPEMVQEQKW